MSNREIFKNGCMSSIQLATGSKCKKKLYLGPGAQGALNSELVKSLKNQKNTNSTVLESLQQNLQLLLHTLLHLTNSFISTLNIGFIHICMYLKFYP